MLLRQLLYRCEIRFLPVIAEHWLHLETMPNYEELIRMLCDKMLTRSALRKMVKTEAADFVPALQRLLRKDGAETAGSFEEEFGTLRIAGTDKILREKMWQHPVSVTEKLWYRGLIFRENRFIGESPTECYILPEDLLKVLSSIIPADTPISSDHTDLTVRPAIPSETACITPFSTDFPDLFCTALALQRDNRQLEFPGTEVSQSKISFIKNLFTSGNFFSKSQQADTDNIRNLLITNRTAVRIRLLHLWRTSDIYDELTESEELVVKKSPDHNKAVSREFLLQILKDLQPDTWWSFNGFLSAVKSSYPMFLRKTFSENAGQIKDMDGNDLNGIGSWFQLEGAYIRFILFGPLQWLGVIQTAYSDKSQSEPTAFRLSNESCFLLEESADETISEDIAEKPNLEQSLPVISGDGSISCNHNVPRYFRYMAARYCELEKFDRNITILRITPASLSSAENAGLSRKAFLALLQRFSKGKIPPSLERMLASQEKQTPTASIYTATILAVPNVEIMAELLQTSRLEKWILQQLNATSLLIDSKGIKEIRRFLMEREILVDIQL